MIKLKNLWKVALATMAMTAMLVACDEGSSDKKDDDDVVSASYEKDFSDEFTGSDIYVAGLDSKWPDVTNAGNAFLMTKGENDVYTYTFTAEETDANKFCPNGFKFCTENGWMEQYTRKIDSNQKVKSRIEPDTEYDVIGKTKIELELPDKNGKLYYPDNSTKFYLKYNLIEGEEYTVTLNLDTMKVKFSGPKGSAAEILDNTKVAYYAGNMTENWSHTKLIDNSFTFTAGGSNEFVFTVGDWAYKLGGAKITALNQEFELTEDGANISFEEDVLTVGNSYKVTLIVKDADNASVKVTAN